MPRSTAPDSDDAGCTSSSASMIAAYMDTGSHELTISGYPGMNGLGVGKFRRSAAFIVGEHRWFIRYYPKGIDAESADYISLYLELDDTQPSEGAEIIIELAFDLLDQMGEPVPAYSSCTLIHDFYVPWGYPKFIRREELEESGLIENGSFRITCYVKVIDICTENTPARFPIAASPATELQRDLGHLLDTKLGADVQFKVGEETFAAHRDVLGVRSPVFMAELFGSVKENN